MEFVIITLRYIVLVILYLFIFRVIFLIIKDIKTSNAKPLTQITEIPPVSGQVGNTTAGLIIIQSDVSSLKEGTKLNLVTENNIGRGPENRIQILDNFTSHRHASLILKNGQYWLEDLGSKNGTFIAGTRIEKPVALIDGDLFQIGGVTFKFERWAYEV